MNRFVIYAVAFVVLGSCKIRKKENDDATESSPSKLENATEKTSKPQQLNSISGTFSYPSDSSSQKVQFELSANQTSFDLKKGSISIKLSGLEVLPESLKPLADASLATSGQDFHCSKFDCGSFILSDEDTERGFRALVTIQTSADAKEGRMLLTVLDGSDYNTVDIQDAEWKYNKP
jgi:hypothetical protein